MLWTVAFILYFPNLALALRCLYCTGAVKPADCDTVMKCGSHEQCYLDAYVSASGTIRYNLGCRDLLICGGSAHASGLNISLRYKESELDKLNRALDTNTSEHSLIGRAGGLLVCSECCSGNLCSSSGCGNTGYMLPRGPICYNCPYQQTTDDCSTITMCGQDEVCMLLKTVNRMTKEIRYSSNCEHEKACGDKLQQFREISALVAGKRRSGSLNVGGSCIVQCCIHDLCNRDCSSNSSMSTSTSVTTTTPVSTTTVSKPIVSPTLPHVVTTTATSDPCLSNPCMGGTCSIYSNTYRCTCRDGYWGRNCDLVYKTFPALTTLQTPSSTSASTHRTMSTTDTVATSKTDPTKHAPSVGTCPNGWIMHGTSCYMFHTNSRKHWSDANNDCANRKSHLAIIQTAEEFYFLKQELDHRIDTYDYDDSDTSVWIAGTDTNNEGRWEWYNSFTQTYTPIKYFTDWRPGQPNAGNGEQDEDCMTMVGNKGFRWADYHCNANMFYVCEQLAILTQVPVQAQTTANCPYGWDRHHGSCYYFHTNDRSSWSQATSDCANRKSHLAIIETAEEFNFLTIRLCQTIDTHTDSDADTSVWVAGTDSNNEGKWEWYDGLNNTYKPFTYTQWSNAEPNAGDGDHDEDCMAMVGKNAFHWHDYRCNVHMYYVCEQSAFDRVASLVG